MTALTEYLAAWPRRFDWSAAHCGHFVLGWVQAATGRPALAAMPPVAGVRQWARYVNAAGGMALLCERVFGCPPVPVDAAKPGDVLLYPGSNTGGALGILLHGGMGASLSDSGSVVLCPATAAVGAWRLSEVLT
jgi:hypothetical protein